MSSSFMLGRATPLELTQEEEEKLDEEWGISRIGSEAGFGENDDMTGIGLRQIQRSESGMLDLEREREEEAERDRLNEGQDGETDLLEVLETKSMPDLDRPRRVSFAASILDELDGRLRGKSGVLSPEEEADARDRAETLMRRGSSDGPRIKVIERHQASPRKRTRSLNSNYALNTLPLLPDVAAPPSILDGLADTGTVGGKARSDSLFTRPGSALAFSPARPRQQSTFSNSSDQRILSYYSDENAPHPRFRSTTDETDRTPSSFGESDPPRPASAMSLTPSVFTSRFDPNIIRQQREEQLSERPVFAREGGKPPNVILMPAPLAGQQLLPPKKPRKEGPSREDSEEEEEEEELEEEKPQRPAGALYGRSLMDIMEERKIALKAQQRAYVPGSDGRRGMMEWRDSPAAQESLAAQGALAKLEGRVGNEDDVDKKEEEVPLALLPAGGALRQKKTQKETSPTKSRNGLSIFGPDMLYQRELAAARKAEEEERIEREESERRAKEVAEIRARKEERRKLKRKMGSKALEHRDLVDQQLVSGEFKTPGDLLRESQRASAAPTSFGDPIPPARSHGIAPSISIPNALDLASTGSDWFLSTQGEGIATEKELEDEEDDPRYTPRRLDQNRKSGFFDSDSEDEDGDNDRADKFARPSSRQFGVDPNLDVSNSHSRSNDDGVRRLALPGEPSSQGYDQDEEEDEVPLGRRYSRQSLALISPVKGDDSDSDNEPLARRQSRHSQLLSPPPKMGSPVLDLKLPSNDEPLLSFAGEAEEVAVDSDEDDKSLGQRFSTIRPVDNSDEDDVPLAFRRLSLAPSALMHTSPYSNRFQPPQATLTALDDREDVEVIREVVGGSEGGDSDDLPLGLKQNQPPSFPNNPSMYFPPPQMAPYSHPHQSFYGFPPPQQSSQFFVPPPPHMGMPPAHDPSMQLAMAQMQMHAAVMSGAAVGGGGGGGPGEGIENWRRGVV